MARSPAAGSGSSPRTRRPRSCPRSGSALAADAGEVPHARLRVEDAPTRLEERGGASARFVAVHTDDRDGRRTGSCHHWHRGGLGPGRHQPRGLASCCWPAVRRGRGGPLRFVLDIDLVGTVTRNAGRPAAALAARRPAAVTCTPSAPAVAASPRRPGLPRGAGLRRAGEVVPVVDERGAGRRYLLEGPDGACCRRVDRTRTGPAGGRAGLAGPVPPWHTLAGRPGPRGRRRQLSTGPTPVPPRPLPTAPPSSDHDHWPGGARGLPAAVAGASRGRAGGSTQRTAPSTTRLPATGPAAPWPGST